MNIHNKHLEQRFRKIEKDIAFIKGELSGRNHKTERVNNRFVFYLAIGAFVISVATLFVRIFVN